MVGFSVQKKNKPTGQKTCGYEGKQSKILHSDCCLISYDNHCHSDYTGCFWQSKIPEHGSVDVHSTLT